MQMGKLTLMYYNRFKKFVKPFFVFSHFFINTIPPQGFGRAAGPCYRKEAFHAAPVYSSILKAVSPTDRGASPEARVTSPVAASRK